MPLIEGRGVRKTQNRTTQHYRKENKFALEVVLQLVQGAMLYARVTRPISQSIHAAHPSHFGHCFATASLTRKTTPTKVSGLHVSFHLLHRGTPHVVESAS